MTFDKLFFLSIFRSKKLIKDAIQANNFLKHLEKSQVQEIVNSMFLKSFEKGQYVIKEGENGTAMYVLAGK